MLSTIDTRVLKKENLLDLHIPDLKIDIKIEISMKNYFRRDIPKTIGLFLLSATDVCDMFCPTVGHRLWPRGWMPS